MFVTDFQDREQLEAWLKTKPIEVSLAIASRAALRAFPMIIGVTKFKGKRDYGFASIILQSLRRMALPWVCIRYNKELKTNIIEAYTTDSPDSAARYVSLAADYAAISIIAATPYSHAATATYYGSRAASAAIALQIDYEFINKNGLTLALSNMPLWHNKQPDWVNRNFAQLQQVLRAENKIGMFGSAGMTLCSKAAPRPAAKRLIFSASH